MRRDHRVDPRPGQIGGAEPPETDPLVRVGGPQDVAPGPGAADLHRQQTQQRDPELRPVTSERWRKNSAAALKKRSKLERRSASGHRAVTPAPPVPDTDTHTLPPSLRLIPRRRGDVRTRPRALHSRPPQPLAPPPQTPRGDAEPDHHRRPQVRTTSIHHYLGLHPEIQMSKPKELNFFVAEMNWDLGLDWYASRFDDRSPVRGESSPHYTNLPRFEGVAGADQGSTARTRCLPTWSATRSSGPLVTGSMPPAPATRRGEMVPALWARHRVRLTARSTGCSCSPTWSCFDRSQIEVMSPEELQTEREATMRKAFAFAGVDPDFTSQQFDREWRNRAPRGRQIRVHGEADQTAGFRSFDRFSTACRSRCAGSWRRSSTTRRSRRRRSRTLRRAARDPARALRRARRRPCSASSAMSPPAGTTILIAPAGSPRGFGRRRPPPDPGRPRSPSSSTPTAPGRGAGDGRPHVAMNFASTRRRPGDDRRPLRRDRLRQPTRRCWPGCGPRFDAVMIGAGTMRAERYGRAGPRREEAGGRRE